MKRLGLVVTFGFFAMNFATAHASDEASVNGWVAPQVGSVLPWTVEIQDPVHPSQSGDTWAELELTTDAQEALAERENSSQTRRLTHFVGSYLPGTADPAVHKLDTIRVTRMVVCPAPGSGFNCMPIVSPQDQDICADQAWVSANCPDVGFVN
jgi:hypothetical protein